MNKTLIGILSLAATLGAYVAPAAAQVSINIGPPPSRMELVPAPRRGEVWNPGYWDVRGRRHVWIAGSWARDRPGYQYNQPQWVSSNGRWILVRPHWTAARPGNDRDRDGIPNRYDRDRDGDGVPNNRDARPNNPNRR